MVKIKPFCGIRPPKQYASEVASRPYDVLNSAEAKAEALAIAEKLKSCQVKIAAKGGEGGKLFGAITGAAIADALQAQHGLTIDGKKLVLDQPIKSFGSYEVKAKLGYEVSGTVYVLVIEEK